MSLMNPLFRLLICVFCVSILSNCSEKEQNDHLVFRYNEHKNIGSLDPAFSKDLADIWATNQLFNGLVQMNENLEVIPSIAKSWDVSEDAKTYTFYLRDDVYFHKHSLFGQDSIRKVKAHDFDYSFSRLTDKKVASPGGWVMAKVNSFKSLNDSTFQITLNQPFPAFLGLLTMKYCSVVPHEIVEHYGSDFRSNPIGTGPFKFKRWEENIKLVLRKNEHYFEKDDNGDQLPYLEAVAITFLPDKQSEFLQFSQGNIDFVSGLDASYKDEILNPEGELQLAYSDKVKMIRGPYLNTEYLAFFMDSDKDEILSEEIRMAANMGFDKKKMMRYLRNGIGIPANGGFIPKGLPGYNEKMGYAFDQEKAKLLIDEYQRKSGNLNPQITLTTTSNYLDFCEFIQKELQKCGLEIIVDVIPASSLKDSKANGKLDMFRASWIADYPDAENYLSLYYSKNFAPNGPNYTHFAHSEFDDLYESAFLIPELDERVLLYEQMDSIVMSKAPIIPMFYDEVVRFTRKEVSGLGINPTNLLELKRVKKSRLE